MKDINKNSLNDIQKDILLRTKTHTETVLEAINEALKDDATEFEIKVALLLAHEMGIH